MKLPPLPTITIGSFPQTQEVRKLRVKLNRGEITQAEYEAVIDAEIAKCIQFQEEAELIFSHSSASSPERLGAFLWDCTAIARDANCSNSGKLMLRLNVELYLLETRAGYFYINFSSLIKKSHKT